MHRIHIIHDDTNMLGNYWSSFLCLWTETIHSSIQPSRHWVRDRNTWTGHQSIRGHRPITSGKFNCLFDLFLLLEEGNWTESLDGTGNWEPSWYLGIVGTTASPRCPHTEPISPHENPLNTGLSYGFYKPYFGPSQCNKYFLQAIFKHIIMLYFHSQI